jgi:hypothetical protein
VHVALWQSSSSMSTPAVKDTELSVDVHSSCIARACTGLLSPLAQRNAFVILPSTAKRASYMPS